MPNKIIEKVRNLLTEEETINKATARNFNMYRILGIESKETYICRAIASLLDNNYHNQGDCFLKLFFEQVLNREYKKKVYQIITEYQIKNGRRIDIAIKTKENEIEKEFIPIEVKIYANDQKNQCYDYCKYNLDNFKEKKVFYLTIKGSNPSDYSLNKENDKDFFTPIFNKEEDDKKEIIGYEEIECISFEKHILSWLSECLKCDCAIRIDNIRIMILQLQENIRALTSTGDKINSKIQKLFNCENISDVQTIYKDYNNLKKTVIEKFFELIENHYEISETNKSDNIDKREANERYPYIRFKIGNEIENNINIWFSVEINEETGRLWAGINCSRDKSWFDAVKEGYYVKYIKNEIKKDISSDEWLTRDWWLLNKTVEGSPNFYDLVEFTKWWNNSNKENKKDNDKGNIETLLENIDIIKDQLKDLFSYNFPKKSENIELNKKIEKLYDSEFAEANVKIAEAFNDYKFKFQNEWRNFIIDIIEKETNLRCINNVKGRDGKLLSDNLYFNLYDGNDYHILFAIEFLYCGLVIADKNFKQMDNSSDKKGKLYTIIDNNNLFTENKEYDKEKDKYKTGWWLYFQNNNFLNSYVSDDDFIKKYNYMKKGECQEIKKIINEIKYFKDKLSKL